LFYKQTSIDPNTKRNSDMKKRIILSLTATLGLAAGANAQIIFSENFDAGLSPGAGLGGGWIFGDAVSKTSGIVGGAGTSGSSALQLVLNTAANGNGYAGGAMQLQEMTTSGNTSLNLSDYTLSFDVQTTAGSLNLQLQTWAGNYFGGSMSGTLNTAPASPGYGNDLNPGTAYTHYDLNLANATVFPNVNTFVPTGGTWQIAFQLNGGGNGNPSQLTLNVDNVVLTMTAVPEPATAALAGLGAAGLLIFRRRQA
jgi:hypothetical protein